mmetsp:Transcript_87873/g.174443  ORF Transcript_87873/g.174443 Transcript_87873/m.174443 type:complete len:524 (+) Transcript_87873:60-1631(+)
MLRMQLLPLFWLLWQPGALGNIRGDAQDSSCRSVRLQDDACFHMAPDPHDVSEVSLLQLSTSILQKQAPLNEAGTATLAEWAGAHRLKALAAASRPELHKLVASARHLVLGTPRPEAEQPVGARSNETIARPTEHSDFMMDDQTIMDEFVWIRVARAKRLSAWSKFRHRLHLTFASAGVIDWIFFLAALAFFLQLHLSMLKWPSEKGSHGMALLVWILAGGLYNLVILTRLGAISANAWLTGYWLEFIFSIENVFVFQVVSRAFRIPRDQAQKALIVVVCCQLIFQMVFYIGLAELLIHIRVLPYLLGAWLIWVAFQTLKDDDDLCAEVPSSPPAEEAVMGRLFGNPSPCSVSEDAAAPQRSTPLLPCITGIFKSLLGDRFVASYSTGPPQMFSCCNGQWNVTLLVPATCCLLAADFMMEIDVTLTKIMEIQQPFVAFTSSMAAAFAVPELFFVAQDLFQRFRLLKYGVSFVLIFFGGLLLLHSFVQLHDIVCLGVIAAVMAVCMLLSHLLPAPQKGRENTLF